MEGRAKAQESADVLIVWKGSERSLGCWIVAANAQLVAVRVTEIRTIKVRMIVRPQTGFAFASSAIGDGSGVAPVHSISSWSE